MYLHVGVLYEGAGYAMWRADLLPYRFGPPWIWLLIGPLVVAAVFWGLWVEKVWVARLIWVVAALRVPSLIRGAFFAGDASRLPAPFYLTALVVVVINMWMLARAGWDL